MTLQYRTTLDELTAAASRAHSAARAQRIVRWGFGGATAAIIGGAVFARIEGGMALPAALAAAASALLLYAGASAWLQRTYIRKAWRAHLDGAPEWIEMAVETTAAGLRVRQQERVSTVPWSEVQGARVDRYGIAIYTRDGFLLHVPQRAFLDEAACSAFRAEIAQRREEAGPAA